MHSISTRALPNANTSRRPIVIYACSVARLLLHFLPIHYDEDETRRSIPKPLTSTQAATTEEHVDAADAVYATADTCAGARVPWVFEVHDGRVESDWSRASEVDAIRSVCSAHDRSTGEHHANAFEKVVGLRVSN